MNKTDDTILSILSAMGFSAFVDDFIFSLTTQQLLAFLDHYHFDYSMLDASRLKTLCAVPVDMYRFAYAVYMCVGSDCLLQTQLSIADALIAFKQNNFSF